MTRPGYTGDVPKEDDPIESIANEEDVPAMPRAESPPAEDGSEGVNAGLPAEPGGGGALAPLDEGVKKAATQYAIVGAGQDPAYLASLLPTKKTKPKTDLGGSIIMIYGPPKIGKSDLASQFPSPLFLATEEGHSHLSIYKAAITSWQHYLDTVQALITYDGELPYRTIVIDTVDLLLDFCLSHYVQNADVNYPSDEAYGKGWDALKREWQKGIFALIKLGYTVVFISHAKPRKVVMQGIERDVITPSLGTTGSKVVGPSVDYIIYLDYAPEEETKDGRRMVLRGDGTIEAGDRSGFLPDQIPEVSYAALEKAFMDYVVPGLQQKYGG